MCDDANPDARVRQAPKSLGGAFDYWHGGEHVVLKHSHAVVIGILVGSETPLVEIPTAFHRICLDWHVVDVGDDLAKPAGVVSNDPIEIDTKNERTAHGLQPARL